VANRVAVACLGSASACRRWPSSSECLFLVLYRVGDLCVRCSTGCLSTARCNCEVSGPIILAAVGGWRWSCGWKKLPGSSKDGGPDGVALYTCRRFED